MAAGPWYRAHIDVISLLRIYGLSVYDAMMISKEFKKGSADLMILSLLEDRARHGYEIAQLIDERSEGAIGYHVASLYPTLYSLEARGFVEGRWVERAGQRRRRYYRLTARGRRHLQRERAIWQQFFVALNRVGRFSDA